MDWDKTSICMISCVYLRYKNDTRGLMIYEINKNLIQKGLSMKVVAPNSDNYKNFEILDNTRIYRFNYFYPKKYQVLAYGSGIPVNLRNSNLAKIQVPLFFFSFLNKALKIAPTSNIIHAQWIAAGFVGLFVKKITKKPLIVTVRRISNKGIMKYVNKVVLKNADYITFNSNYMMEESLKIAKPKKCSVIHNILDSEKFKPQESNLRKKLNIDKNTKVILFLGLLVEKKGLPYLVNAFKKIHEEDNNTVLIIGGHGIELDHLKKLGTKLNIIDKMIFLGHIEADKTPELFNIADIFILPSIIDSQGETETLGVVLLEAMACEKPVIASRIGGIIDFVDDKVGYLVEPKNSDQIAEKAILLLKDEKKRKELGKAGRKRVLEKFSAEKLTQDLLKVYKEVGE
ncbi:MAG: glycosyltransferase [Nanoarchaeota archaeon]|nr:glycosyltransferase [Nanoarchaeota archaeon]